MSKVTFLTIASHGKQFRYSLVLSVVEIRAGSGRVFSGLGFFSLKPEGALSGLGFVHRVIISH